MDALAVITVSNPPPSRIDNGVAGCGCRYQCSMDSPPPLSAAGEIHGAARFMVVRCGVMPSLYLSCRLARFCAVDGVSILPGLLVMAGSRFSG